MTYDEAVEAYISELAGDPVLSTEPGFVARLRVEIERQGLPPDVASRFGVAPALRPVGESLRLVTEQLPRPVGPLPPTSPPACATCGDAGVVYLDVPRHDARHGKADICPHCDGSVRRTRMQAERRAHHRMLWPLRADIAREAKRELETDYFQRAMAGDPFAAENMPRARRQLAHACEAARRYSEAWPAAPLVLVGPSGNGKSTLAAKLYAVAWRRGMGVAWLTGAELGRVAENWWQAEGGRSVKERELASYSAVDLLILDEADHATLSDTQERQRGGSALFEIVDARLRAALPLVITANALEERLGASAVGRAILSRLRVSSGAWIDMSAVPDARPYYG